MASTISYEETYGRQMAMQVSEAPLHAPVNSGWRKEEVREEGRDTQSSSNSVSVQGGAIMTFSGEIHFNAVFDSS